MLKCHVKQRSELEQVGKKKQLAIFICPRRDYINLCGIPIINVHLNKKE